MSSCYLNGIRTTFKSVIVTVTVYRCENPRGPANKIFWVYCFMKFNFDTFLKQSQAPGYTNPSITISIYHCHVTETNKKPRPFHKKYRSEVPAVMKYWICLPEYVKRGIFYFYVLYSTLLHLPPLSFPCVGGCWDRTPDCCDFGIGSNKL
jgi:hypothetical protein